MYVLSAYNVFGSKLSIAACSVKLKKEKYCSSIYISNVTRFSKQMERYLKLRYHGIVYIRKLHKKLKVSKHF